MKTICVSVGHGPKIDKGADNSNGTTELAWNRDLAAKILRHIDTDKFKALIVNRAQERVMNYREVNASGADVAIELHCNAFNKSATGTEMIYHPKSARGKKLATMLLDAAVGVLGLPNRGIKPPQGGGRGMSFLQGTKMPAVIVETMFIDNGTDLRIASERKDDLAKAYANALMEFLA